MSDTHDLMLNLRQVECFVRSVEAGTMTAAAEQLLVSQSAVSLAVAGLENALGTQLLVRRRSRGLALTAAGRRFLPQAKELLAHAEDVRADVQSEGSELAGGSSSAASEPPRRSSCPACWRRSRPSIPASGSTSSKARCPSSSARSRKAGARSRWSTTSTSAPASSATRSTRPSPTCCSPRSHPLAAQEELALATLAEHPMVMLDVPPSSAYFHGVFAEAGVEPDVRFNVSSYELLRSLVARDLGYGLLISRPAADVSYEGRPLVARRLAGDPLPIDVSLAWVAGVRRTRRARAFADHCRRMLPHRLGGGIGQVHGTGGVKPDT